MQLPVRLESTITDAKWDEVSKLWTVEVEKDGSKTSLKPAHIVLATGLHSDEAHVPDFPGTEEFKGPIIHSTKYTTASDIPDYKSKNFIIIGAAASAQDIAQDLVNSGVAAITMVQRDAVCVYSLNSKVNVVGAPFMKPGISTDDSDILVSSMPFPVALTMMVGGTQMMYQMDKELLDRVDKTEFKFLKGDDGRGLLHLLFAKAGRACFPPQTSFKSH
jgi:cation diffusion facilitator CzcD-associated flavoprotein CzcO